MNLLALTPEEINVVLSATSSKMNFSTNVVEKDWWVTMVLKALFQTSCAEYLTFKGGTSLSKGWGLIERFSEDIDVAFDKSFWGVEGINKSQRDKIRKKTRAYIESDLLPELDSRLKEMEQRIMSWNLSQMRIQTRIQQFALYHIRAIVQRMSM